MIHTSAFRVRYYECDAYGHLNNVNYVRFLGETMLEASAAAGYSPARCDELGRRWETQALQIEYLRPVRYGDSVEVVAAPVGCRRTGTQWAYDFRRAGSEEVVCRGMADVSLVDAAAGEPALLPSDLATALCPESAGAAAPLIASYPIAPAPPAGVFAIRRRVTWQDLGAARRLDDAAYLGFLEEAGMGVVAAHGWPASRMAAEGFAIILRRHQVEFCRPASLDDELEIATWVSDMQRVSALRHYTITRVADGATLARVHTLGVWVNLSTGRPMRMPAQFVVDFAPNIAGAGGF